MALPTDYGMNWAINGAYLLACAFFLLLIYLVLLFCTYPSTPKARWAEPSDANWRLPITSSGSDLIVQNDFHSFFPSASTRSTPHGKQRSYRILPLLIDTWVSKSSTIKLQGLCSAISAGIHGLISKAFHTRTAHAKSTTDLSRARYPKSLLGLPSLHWTLIALSPSLQWLRACFEDLHLDTEITTQNHYRDLIVIPVHPDTESGTQDHEENTQDSNSGSGSYYGEEEYYPQSPMLERVYPRAAPSPSPPPQDSFVGLDRSPTPPLFIIEDLFLDDEGSDKEDVILRLVASAAEQRREKLHSIPLLSHASRGRQENKGTRPTQGDWVLIREMAPNRSDIATQVSQVALDSDSATDTTGSEDSMSIELDSGLSVVNNPDASFVGSPRFDAQSQTSWSRDDLDIPTMSLSGYHSRSEMHHSSPALPSDGGDTNYPDFDQYPDVIPPTDWIIEDLFLSLPDYDTNTSGAHFGFDLADATRESVQYFASTTEARIWQMADQVDTELLHAVWQDGRNDQMYGIPLEWVNNDGATGETMQPTLESSFVQRHLIRQSLLDEGFLLVSPARLSEDDDMTTAQNIAHIECSAGQDASSACVAPTDISLVDDGIVQEERKTVSRLKRRHEGELGNAEGPMECPTIAKRVRSLQADASMSSESTSPDLATINTSRSSREDDIAMNTDESTGQSNTITDENNSFSLHLILGHPSPSDSLTCPHCALSFISRALVNNHIRRKHARRFKCGSCERRFNLKADLHRHQRCVHAQGTQSWTCSRESCIAPGTVFTRKDNFRRHVKRCERNGTADET